MRRPEIYQHAFPPLSDLNAGNAMASRMGAFCPLAMFLTP